MTQEFDHLLLANQDCFNDIIGQDEVKLMLKSALLAQRHVIIIGTPGIGKTTLGKNIAKLLPELKVNKDCSYHCIPEKPICPECKNGKNKGSKTIPGSQRFIRVQGSPDLTVEDLLGDIDPIKALQYGPLSIEAFTPGKIFKANNGVLFFDELNRCPEKLQNALLQVLQENKATIGSYDVDLEANFLFIATMNPEDSTTEKLSDVLLDRFDVIYMSAPETSAMEEKIVTTHGKKLVMMPTDLLGIMTFFVRSLRHSADLEKKPSVRASIGLYERSQAHALLMNKKKVSIEDLKAVLHSVLAHRIRLKPSLKYVKSPELFITEEFKKMMATNIGKDLSTSEGDLP